MSGLLRVGAGVCVWLIVATATPAADEVAVQRAVDRGAVALRRLQRADGTWQFTEIGATALAGLALLECGTPPSDPSIQQAAAAIRRSGISVNTTYSVALCLLFLDRIGDAGDVPLIESLGVRLLGGQLTDGGWGYNCPEIAPSEVRRLTNAMTRRRELVAGTGLPGARRTVKDLPREIQNQLENIARAGGRRAFGDFADNSNTQFAILALWVARRHGLPVERAMKAVETRFRRSQGTDGGWGYIAPGISLPIAQGLGTASTPSMTCAGLLGLALGFGTANEAALRTDPKAAPGKDEAKPHDPGADPAVKRGLLALGTAIDHPQMPGPMPGPRPGLPPGRGPGPPPGRGPGPGLLPGRGPLPLGPIPGGIPVLQGANGKGYYFLWSLERVAVAYGLDTIGNKDWYNYGSDILLANQGADGLWRGEYAECGADTCFALLFLRKANLARDLTASLKGKVQDPDTRELSGGGVGGADFVKKIGLKAAFDNNVKPGEAAPPMPPTKAETTPVPAVPESTRLADTLVKAPSDRQDLTLQQMRDGKGAVYTEALAEAIGKVDGPLKGKARDALADRLARMTPATLREKLKESNLEVRRAAALACAMKDDKAHVPDLIELLEDREPVVVRAAHAALKSLSGQGLGTTADEWRAWWKKSSGK